MDDKDPKISSFPVPTILRASNTTQTLKPTEVSSFPGDSAGVAEQYYNLKNAEFESTIRASNTATISQGVAESLGCVIDENGTLHDAKAWAVDYDEAVKKSLESEDWDNAPVIYQKPEEDKTWVLSKLLDRIELLEEKVDGLLERLEIHNVKASHKI